MRILITGASRGLGLMVTNVLESEGHFITRVGRSDHLLFDPEQDAVIHCAGGGLGLRDVLLTEAQLNELMHANLGLAVSINAIVGLHMRRKRAGYIVHVCSIASGEAIGSVGYNTVKAALAAYVRSLGRELAPDNVVVTGIAPGAFEAPGNAMERLKKSNPEAYNAYLNKRLPRGFMGNADELIPLIKFLISPQASMMAGSVIPIDAGEGHYYT